MGEAKQQYTAALPVAILKMNLVTLMQQGSGQPSLFFVILRFGMKSASIWYEKCFWSQEEFVVSIYCNVLVNVSV